MDHELRRSIILKLIHNPRLSFNELWDKQGPSNTFAYHLKRLVEEGVVEEFEDGYGLSLDGRSLATDIEGDTGAKTRFPTPTVVIIARDGDGNILPQQRRKEPFFGYWGFPSGKINFGWNPQERAVRDLEEETGLRAGRVELRCIEHIKTFEGEELAHHHIMYIFEAFELEGELIEQTHKARHEWMSVEEYLSRERFPGEWLWDVMLPTDSFFIMEGERFMEDGSFVGAQMTRFDEYEKQ